MLIQCKLPPACCSRLGGSVSRWASGTLRPAATACFTWVLYCTGCSIPMARRAGAVLRRGLCGAAGAGAVRQCRPGGQQLPRPQTRSSQCAGPASRARAARRQAALAGSAYRRCVGFVEKTAAQRRLIPNCCRRALARLARRTGRLRPACDQLLLPVLLGCCTAPGAASPWPGARSAVLRRGLCGAAGAGAVRQCRPGGQQLPRPQTFQPMRWACQPSQSSTPASSPCGISVSPLRRVLLKNCCAATMLIPQGAARLRPTH